MVILIASIAGVVGGFLVLWFSTREVHRVSAGTGLVTGVGILVIGLIVYAESYSESIELQAHRAVVITEFGDAVGYYEDRIVVDAQSLTDTRYAQLASLIRDLRDKTVRYNRIRVEKALWRANWLVGSFVHVSAVELPEIRFLTVVEKE
jgi:hypothetical protein